MAAKAGGKKSGLLGTIIIMVVLTLLAGGGGVVVGKLISAKMRPPPAPMTAASAPPPLPYGGDIDIRELPPIVTNLANPSNVAVRLQAALVFGKKPAESASVLTAQIGDDLVAFLKTLSLTEIQGASGLQNLREDLNERAAIRSQGSVREVIIETLVTQ